MDFHEIVQRVQDVDAGLVGKAAITAAGGMTTLQVVTMFGSILLIALNIALAIGGLYLLVLKARRERSLTRKD
jgi:hypothetical protein